MDIGNAITRDIVFGQALADAAPVIVAFGVNSGYVRPLGIAMTSIFTHTPGVEAHVFCDAAPADDDARRLAATADKHKAQITWHVINNAAFEKLPRPDYASVATYYRFLVGDYFYGKADRLLYLDADTLCLRDLHELYATPLLPPAAVAAVRDDKRSDDRGRDYFNAGVMLIDVGAWHELEVTDKAIDLLGGKKHYRYLDQDVLNIIYSGQVAWLPATCNQLPNADDDYPAGTTVIHYTGGSKPWTAWYFCKRSGLYERYRAASEWADVPLVTTPRTRVELRLMSRTAFQRGDWLGGLYWQFQYLCRKLFGGKAGA